jgi:hypothetical protein
MDGAWDRETKYIEPKFRSISPDGLKIGARFRRTPVLRPAGAPGLIFWLMPGYFILFLDPRPRP